MSIGKASLGSVLVAKAAFTEGASPLPGSGASIGDAVRCLETLGGLLGIIQERCKRCAVGGFRMSERIPSSSSNVVPSFSGFIVTRFCTARVRLKATRAYFRSMLLEARPFQPPACRRRSLR